MRRLYLAAAMACVLLLPGCGGDVPDDPALSLNPNNAKQMHIHGMPTAEDVIHYKTHGTWAYVDSLGRMRESSELPGDARAWYELYDIEW